MSKDYIKDYWETQAKVHGGSHWASWGDNWMIDLEVDEIARHINNNDKVLDVGCANGYSTFRQNELHALSSIDGVDFSRNMVDAANKAKSQKKNLRAVNFIRGDVTDIPFDDCNFDIAYTSRVLINLPTWKLQVKGIKECLRVVRPGGTVVLSEGFWEPLMLLNAVRSLSGLAPLVEHDFNRYLKLSKLKSFLSEIRVSYDVVDYSSIYYLGSRFLRELVTDVSAYPGFTNPINKIFYEIEKEYSGGGFGVQQAVIIKK